MLWEWILDAILAALPSLSDEPKDALVWAPDALGSLGRKILLYNLRLL